MNKKQAEILIRKYEEGLTNLKEESELFELSDQDQSENSDWFRLLKSHRLNTPNNLESDIWDKIHRKEKNKIKTIRRIRSIAASLILFLAIGFVFNPWKDKAMSLQEKEQALKEALQMFQDQESRVIDRNIIYEDESIIIYLN